MSKRKGRDAQSFLENLSKKPKNEELPKAFTDDLETADIFVGKNEYFENACNTATDDDIMWEYNTFIKTLPTSLPNDVKKNLIDKVYYHMQIFDVNNRICASDKTVKSKQFSDESLRTPILDALSAKLGQSLTIIAPPSSTCLYCKKLLTKHNDPTQVQLHTRLGTVIATKHTLRCRSCKEARQHTDSRYGAENDIHYNPTRYGNIKDGFKFYPKEYDVDLVTGSNCSYVENLFAKQYFAELHHGWLSSQAKTEAFNETNRGTYQAEQTIKFLELNPNVGKQFQRQTNDDEEVEDNDDDDEEDRFGKGDNRSMSRMHELKKKTLSQAMVNHEIKSELLENNKVKETRLGPMKQEHKTLTFKVTAYNLMKTVNENRKTELYKHNKCHEGCRKRGCEKITVFDGNWKIQFPICMWESSTDYPTEITGFVPQVCPEQPEHRSAFCSLHGKAAKSLGKPFKLREFLKSCGTDPDNFTKEAKGKVKAVLKTMASRANVVQTKVGEEQGTEYLLRNRQLMNPANLITEETEDEPLCRKSLGDCHRLQGYNRGVYCWEHFVFFSNEPFVLV